jgi:O-antigen ligase
MYRLLSGAHKQIHRLPKPLKWGLVMLGMGGLGFAVGWLLTSTAQSAFISVLGILLYFLAVVINPLGGVLVWLVAYPFIEGTINISLGASIPDLSPTRFCIAFLTTMLLAQSAIRKRPFFGFTSTEFFYLLFVLGMILSALTAVDKVDALQVILDAYVVPIITYFIVRNLVVDKKALNAFINGLLVIATYAAVYIIFEQLTGIILFTDKDLSKINVQYTESLRLTMGLFGGVHIFGVIFTMTIPIIFYRLLNARMLSRRNLYLFLLGLTFVGLYFTYKRASWIAMLVSLLIMWRFYPKFGRLFIALLLLCGLFVMFNRDTLAESAVATERLTENWETFNGRTQRWEEALALWQKAPIFGHGFRQFDVLAEKAAVESLYLHVLVSAGIVGLIPYLLMVLSIFKDSIAIFRRSPSDPRFFVDRELIVAFWAGYSTYLVKAITGIMLEPITNILVFAFIGAVVGSQRWLLCHPRSGVESPQRVSLPGHAAGKPSAWGLKFQSDLDSPIALPQPTQPDLLPLRRLKGGALDEIERQSHDEHLC